MKCRNHALVKMITCVFAPLALTLLSGEPVSGGLPPKHTRVADVIGGHVHPSICVTHSGMIIVVYNKEGGGGKRLLLCHSQDQGESWSAPRPINTICNCSIYPGSLTTLSDGSLLLNWSCYRVENDRLWREPQFSLSEDEGVSWSTVQSVPLDNLSNYSCLRHPVVELSENNWVLPFYDRTVVYDYNTHAVRTFGDGRNHGMVPMVRTAKGTLISGAPQGNAPVPVGKPGNQVRGMRSTNGGKTWNPLHAFPHFGVAGYDLTVLHNGWIVLTAIIYGFGQDGEWGYELIVSRDDGLTWQSEDAIIVYNPGRRIAGRGWPRTVQLDADTLGTLFYDLDKNQPGGPGIFFVKTKLDSLGSSNPSQPSPLP